MIFKKSNNNNGYVKLKSGNVIKIESLGEHVPFVMVRINPIHLNICEFIADKFYCFKPDSIEWEVLVNFLSQRSEKIKIITSIVLLARRKKITEINIKYMGAEFEHFFNYKVFFENPVSHSSSFIDKSQKVNSFLKYFLNKLYYLLRNRNLRSSTSVIRSWVDVDEELHKKHFKNAVIYIYPFTIKIIRGIKFIKHCFNTYNKVSFMGVNYSWDRLVKVILNSKKKSDYSIIDYEIDAMRRHRKEFTDFKCIFTSDEFIPAINVLYDDFLSTKIIVNNSHGIGFYNPYVKYTKMIVFNKFQRNYYQKRNSNVVYSIKEQDNNITISPRNLEIFLVLIDQGDLKKNGLLYEHNLQNRVISKIQEVAIDLNYRCFIKFHPNRSKNKKISFLKNYKSFKEISAFRKNNSVNYIFINLYSTAYYDYCKYGQFIFVKEGLFDPSLFFGNSIQASKVEDLRQTIVNMVWDKS